MPETNMPETNNLNQIKFLQKLSESSRVDWSRVMVYDSIDRGNDETCQAVPVVLFLVFRKNNFTPQHGQRRTKF